MINRIAIASGVLLLVGCLQPKPGNQDVGSVTIEVFGASPTEIGTSGTATLSWTTTNADTCAISGVGEVSVNGSVGVTPSADTTYALACQGINGPAVAQAAVTTVLVWYADPAAAAGGDGTSWSTAFDVLQDAVDQASTEGGQVWVAAGTYKPPGANLGIVDLPANARVYGGFTGAENGFSERPSPLATTALDGDLTDDGFTADDGAQLVTAAADGSLLDGFTVTGANVLGGSGGGITVDGGTGVTLNNLIVDGNAGDDIGAGIAVINAGEVTVSNSTISNNSALTAGAGVQLTSGAGGAVTITDTTFDSNAAAGGGAIFMSSAGTLDVSDSQFVNNAANGTVGSALGGAIFLNSGAGATITGSVFADNEVTNPGVFNHGGAIAVIGSPTTITDCTFTMNGATRGGALYAGGSAVTLEDSLVADNTAVEVGGGVYVDSASTTDVSNTTFLRNIADLGGAAGRDLASAAVLSIVGSTMTGNSATSNGGAVFDGAGGAGSMTLTNNVLWGNTAAVDPEVSGAPTVNNSCVAGGFAGTGNVTLDAVSDNPFDIAQTGELFLLPASTCVDAGDDAAATAAGIDWQNLTTQSDQSLDQTPVDIGRHYSVPVTE